MQFGKTTTKANGPIRQKVDKKFLTADKAILNKKHILKANRK